MKPFKLSFPFFYSLLFICFVKGQALVAQTKAPDSIAYYQKIYTNTRNSDSLLEAYKYFESKQHWAASTQNYYEEARAYAHLAIIQQKIGFLNDSEVSAVNALRLLDEHVTNLTSTSDRLRLSLFNHLGKIYREYGDYPKALEYYRKGLEIHPSLIYKITLWNNIGFTFLEAEQFPKAEAYFEKAKLASKQQHDSVQWARALDNIGVAQLHYHNPKAYANLEEALHLRKLLGRPSGLITSYLNIASYFHQQKDSSLAQLYMQKAENLALQTKNVPAIEEVLSSKMKLKNDLDYQQIIHIKDSIRQQELQSQNKYASLKYEKTKEKERADRNELLKEKEKRKKTIYQSLGIFILILAIAIFIVLKIYHKKETLTAVLKTESRISKTIHDEVSNDVYHVMTKLQATKETDEHVLDNLENIYEKTRNISRQNREISTQGDFAEIIRDLLLSFTSQEISIVTPNLSQVNWQVYSRFTKEILYKVLQELMVNMKKHSHATLVVLHFTQSGKKLSIRYKDNGVGCSLTDKNGLGNAESRMRNIRGSLTFDSQPNQGFEAIIKL